MSRLVRLIGVLAAVAVLAGGGWWLSSRGAAASPLTGTAGEADTSSATTTAAVERKTLTVTDDFNGTLGFAGDYHVIGGLSGILTWTVPTGTVVTAGKRLYETNGHDRTSLMYGSRPAWRTMESGVTNGPDILQLETNLKKLGFTRKGDKIDSHWDARTTAAVKRWQRKAGLPVDGIVDLGEVVFLPEAVRITEVSAALGTMVGPGGPVLSGTSSRRVVSLDLDAADRDAFDVGKAVQVKLPDGSTVAGKIATIARIAESSTDQQGNTTTTIPVTITLDDPTAAGDLDQASVTITVVRSSRQNVLTVPVNALLALREGGYAVEVVVGGGSSTAAPSASPSLGSAAGSASPGARTHLVRVVPGLFDHGNVEITATGIQPGDLVVVPS
ncbi:MAG TPA: peptidoglycan-binding protein [Candidatus Dormibacteraeota bacterium]|nr:peptidoglycan-binding protein [Candidatus Dormibacteraeota bacterium]